MSWLYTFIDLLFYALNLAILIRVIVSWLNVNPYNPLVSFVYQVTERLILPERDQPVEVRLENARWIGPSEDERLTLITCWPEDSNTHRLIVVAEPLSVDRIPDDPGGGPQRR